MKNRERPPLDRSCIVPSRSQISPLPGRPYLSPQHSHGVGGEMCRGHISIMANKHQQIKPIADLAGMGIFLHINPPRRISFAEMNRIGLSNGFQDQLPNRAHFGVPSRNMSRPTRLRQRDFQSCWIANDLVHRASVAAFGSGGLDNYGTLGTFAQGGPRNDEGSETMRVALYVRVFTKEQTTDNQARELRRWAEGLRFKVADGFPGPARSVPCAESSRPAPGLGR